MAQEENTFYVFGVNLTTMVDRGRVGGRVPAVELLVLREMVENGAVEVEIYSSRILRRAHT